VVDDGRPIQHAGLELRRLTDSEHPVRHDSAMLASVVMDIYEVGRRTRPRTKTAGRT
jgi:hypothetical protein